MILWLVGMMGTGKTSAGRRAASDLGVTFVDLDQAIEEKHGATIAEIWKADGETRLRILESEVISEIAEEKGGNGFDSIVATGGGAVLLTENVNAMRSSGVVVWLDATADTLAVRVKTGPERPLLAVADDPLTVLSRLMEERQGIYHDSSDYRIPVDMVDVGGVAQKIKEIWKNF